MNTRNTIQKTVVLETLNKLANHPTADEVYAAIHEHYPHISKATVYRVLNGLAEEGKVLHIRVHNGADHYDHQTFDHYHVRCTCCGSVDDVLIPMLQGIEEQAAAASNYHISGHSLLFEGLCPACLSKKREEAV